MAASTVAVEEKLPLARSVTNINGEEDPPTNLPIKTIPGSYGIPFISPIKDRLDFYYNQGQDKFFQSRVDKYGSTVFRVNAPPGPFMAKNPQVVVVLDAKSFPVLFDTSKVEKKDVFTGTYMPSTSFTGGYRVCSYLDPSEPTHAKVKQLLFNILTSRKAHVIPEFTDSYSDLFSAMEGQLAKSGKSDFNKLNDDFAFEFLGKAYFGVKPSSTSLQSTATSRITKWLVPQLSPLMTLGLPRILEDLLLHTFPIPFFLVKKDYQELYKYFSSSATDALANAQKLGLSKEEACHNLLFATCFNSYGGMKVLLPGILAFLAKAGDKLHARLANEVRSAIISSQGPGLTPAALEKMELTKSVVYEALRLDPPVKYQYGVAKRDLVVESHDVAYVVKAGETIFGYQPFATRDARVFDNAGEFVPDRFVGEAGKKLLKYVVWSNGPETESPTVANKQCAGKDFVVLVGRLLVAAFFLRYDTFAADVGTVGLGAQLTVTALTKATS